MQSTESLSIEDKIERLDRRLDAIQDNQLMIMTAIMRHYGVNNPKETAKDCITRT